MTFHGFTRISRVRGQIPCGGLWGRGPAPIETFARCQFAAIAAISSILMIFMDSWISDDFMRFHSIFMDFMCFLRIS